MAQLQLTRLRYVAGLLAFVVGVWAAPLIAQRIRVDGVTTYGGGITFSPDNTFDIGASLATRPRTGYFATSLVQGGALALGTTSTDGAVFQNTTPATVGTTVQTSPRARFSGRAWNSVGAVSEIDDWFIEDLPATAAGTTTSMLRLCRTIAGGAASCPFTFSDSGSFVESNNFTIAAGNSILASATNGKAELYNNGLTASIGLDWLTASVLKIRTAAQSAYASVDALSYLASGTAITSGTTFLSNGSGMGVANVAANSCGTSAASIVGNNNAWIVTVGATSGSQCRVAFTVTATTGWVCSANDDTTTIAVRTTPVDTTHIDVLGAFIAGDTVSGICFPR